MTNTNQGSTTLPDVEDIDRDLTMNTIDSYFEYRIPIRPNTTINDKYVTDIRTGFRHQHYLMVEPRIVVGYNTKFL